MDSGTSAQPYTHLEAANGEEDFLVGDGEAGAEHGLEVGLVAILTKTGHLPRTGHLHTWKCGDDGMREWQNEE